MRRRQQFQHVALAMLLVAAALLAWGAEQPPGRTEGARTESRTKVTLCHHHTKRVSETAVPAHLAHGDTLGACTGGSGALLSPVPRTGQTTCWDQSGNLISCTGTGQDGEYQKGVSTSPRFTDNGDGTVKDNLTGLVWMQKANCFSEEIWADAIASANAVSDGSCGLADGSVAGDWRLPNVRELSTFIDYGHPGPILPPGHPFTGVGNNNYWTSTTYASQTTGAWVVSFGGGGGPYYKTSLPVRLACP